MSVVAQYQNSTIFVKMLSKYDMNDLSYDAEVSMDGVWLAGDTLDREEFESETPGSQLTIVFKRPRNWLKHLK